MKVITLTQPWATLMAIGAKKIETRSWPTQHLGVIGIHAGKGLSGTAESELSALCEYVPFKSALVTAGYKGFRSLPRGAILCTAVLVSCWRITEDNKPPYPESCFGDYARGRFGWTFANVRRVVETPASGALGLWEWNGELADWKGRGGK